MMRSSLATGVMCVCVLGVVVMKPSAQGGAQGAAQVAPLQNLQVLPKEMTRPEVTALMRTFAAALGVQCTHCHVGTPQERFKDDLPTKATARKMLTMIMAIINDLLKDVGTPAAGGAPKVTCFTCHRGALKPLTVAPPAGGGF